MQNKQVLTLKERARTIKDLVIRASEETPTALPQIYNFVRRWRPGTEETSIRARVYEAIKDGKVVRVMEGVYFARSGPAQLLMVEGSAWDALKTMDDDSIDGMIIDPPGKFGRQWAGTGTTRPHVQLGGRTYPQPELDLSFVKEAFRVLKKQREWNTLSKNRREARNYPKGGAACVIRVPIENRTTRRHVQELITLAESVGFIFYGEIPVILDSIGMGYDAGRDLGAKWLLFHAGERNGVLWDLGVANFIKAKRIRNPAAVRVVEHEAEKDPVEFVHLVRAISRVGDVILDTFLGRGKWLKRVLQMGRHVIGVDINRLWLEKIATEDFGSGGFGWLS